MIHHLLVEILGAEQLIQEQAARTINQERTRTIL